MRRASRFACLFLVALVPMFAQTEKGLDAAGPLKWANTLIFAACLGYLIAKTAPKFFKARSSEIQKAIEDATGLKIEADFRYSEIDRKMATLADEVRRMRDQSAGEMEREHERIRKDSAAEIEHIQHNVSAEIEAFRTGGTRQVREHTAHLAVQLAERKLRDRLTPADQNDLLHHFVHLVEQSKN